MNTKQFSLTLLGLSLVVPGHAQIFSPESLTGAALGGLAGGIIGNNSGRRTGEGIAIGAGTGLLLGSLVHASRRDRGNYAYQPGAGYSYYTPSYSYAYPSYAYPSYGYSYYRRPNYALSGAVIGGLAGGIIGHNHHRQTAEGVAIGAGAGLLFGGLAEHAARQRERAQYYSPQTSYVPVDTAPQTTAEPATPSASQPVIINNYYSGSANSQSAGSPMAGANSLFGR